MAMAQMARKASDKEKPIPVGRADDPAEREADRMADWVLRMPDPVAAPQAQVSRVSGETAPIRRKCAACGSGGAPCPSCGEESLRMKARDGSQSLFRAVSGSHGALGGDLSLGPHKALDGNERKYFEPRFGRDLSSVRIHDNPMAAAAAGSLNARAFTVGSDLAFAGGEYRPGTIAGRRLLGHELTHVIQQGGGEKRIDRQTADTTETDTTVEVIRRQPSGVASWAPQTAEQEAFQHPPEASLTEDAVRMLSDSDLINYAEGYRSLLADPAVDIGIASAIDENLGYIQTEQLRRQGSALQVLDIGFPRPAGLPPDGGFTLIPAGALPPELEAGIPEGQLVPFTLPPTPVGFLPGTVSTPLASSTPLPRPQPDRGLQTSDITSPLAAAGWQLNSAIDYNLMRTGFQAAGTESIGIVGVPRMFSPGAIVPETLGQIADTWGHTAIYVRQGGEIVAVRGFNPAMEGGLLQFLRNASAVRSGSAAVPAAIGSDAYLFTMIGARSIEYPVNSSIAAQLLSELPAPGPVVPGSGIPPLYTAQPAVYGQPCVGSNCVLWAVGEGEEALGGLIGRARSGVSVTSLGTGGNIVDSTASQGRFIQFTHAVEAGEGAIAPSLANSAPVASGMSRTLQVLKIGGKVFFVVGVLAIPVETFLAPEGQRARTFVGGLGGFAGGLAMGATAGLMCGPGAPVCSVVLGLTFGIAGALGGRAAAQAIYDSFARELDAWRMGLNALAKSPGSALAFGLATPLVFRGGIGGLLRTPADLVREDRAAEYEHALEERRQRAQAAIDVRERQLEALRSVLTE